MDEDKLVGVIHVYQAEDGIPYITGKDKDDIPYVTELSGKYEYLKKYVDEKYNFQIKIQNPSSYSIFNEEKSPISRVVAMLLASIMLLICILLLYLTEQVGFAWHTSLLEKHIGAVLGYSICFSLILFGVFIAGILVLAFLNYSFNKKKTM